MRCSPPLFTQLTEDIFISLAHTVQKRNKFICKSKLPAKDTISAGENTAVFHKRNNSFLFMHLPRHYYCKGTTQGSLTLCPMRQKAEKQKKWLPCGLGLSCSFSLCGNLGVLLLPGILFLICLTISIGAFSAWSLGGDPDACSFGEESSSFFFVCFGLMEDSSVDLNPIRSTG